jgi:hypothetical protein
MQRIFIASHRVEAYLLVDRLAHAGIKAHVFNEHMSSIVGDVPPEVSQPQVWLDDDADCARAGEILKTYREERNRTGSMVCAVRRGESRDVRALLEMRLVVVGRKSRAHNRLARPTHACFVPSGWRRRCAQAPMHRPLPHVQRRQSAQSFPPLRAPLAGDRQPKRRRDSWRRTRGRAMRARRPPPCGASRDGREAAESRGASGDRGPQRVRFGADERLKLAMHDRRESASGIAATGMAHAADE